MSYSVKKAGVSFKTKVNVDPDLTGKAGNFSLTYYNDNSPGTEIVVLGSFVESIDIPGLYFSPAVTVATAGDYTFNIANTVDGLGNVSAPVVVMNATIDEIKTAVDSAQTDITAIKAQTDLLNTSALNDIGTQLTDVQSSVDNINDLIINKTATLTYVTTDETANLVVGDDVVGDSSGALGLVTSVTFGPDTIVEVQNVVGAFLVGETITGTATTSSVDIVVEGNTSVDSVLEFVSQIDDALANGATSLSVLAGYTDNLELMLEGKAYTDTQGGAVLEADSHGLSEIFDELVINGNDIGTAQTAINGLVTAVGTLQSDVSAGFVSIEASVANFKTSVEAKVDAVKTVVDTNSAVLLNAGYGNEALQTLLDALTSTLAAVKVDTTAIETDTDAILTDTTAIALDTTSIVDTLEDATFGLSALKTFLNAMDAKLDSIETKVDNFSATVVPAAKIFI